MTHGVAESHWCQNSKPLKRAALDVLRGDMTHGVAESHGLRQTSEPLKRAALYVPQSLHLRARAPGAALSPGLSLSQCGTGASLALHTISLLLHRATHTARIGWCVLSAITVISYEHIGMRYIYSRHRGPDQPIPMHTWYALAKAQYTQCRVLRERALSQIERP